jgi:CheY-like chemotaxis protein
MIAPTDNIDDDPKTSLVRERAARRAAEAAVRMKDEFLSALSHELRTPLTAILLWARILRDGKLKENERREAISTIERNAAAQAEMIDHLLDISRMASGRTRLNPRVMEMKPAVQAATNAARRMAEAKGVALLAELDSAGATVQADSASIEEVTWILLAEAVRCTPTGGRITVVLRSLADHVRLQVIDTGRRSSARGHANGLDRAGPTLALARQLVERQGGTIRTKNTRRGTTFTVELPLHTPEDAAGAPAAAESSAEFVPSQLLHGLRIVLVEDEVDTRNVLRWLLEQSGAQVRAVDSASKALKLLAGAGGETDVLVSDISMACEDGYDLIGKVRQARSRRSGVGSIHAIAITARADEKTRRHALRAGFKAFMAKPIDPRELVTLIAGFSRPKK